MFRRTISQIERLEPRRLLSDVIPVGPEFQVNTYTTGSQFGPSVAMDAVGDFVVTWSGAGASGAAGYAQRYNAAGVPQGTEFRIGTWAFSVAMDADGDFVVAWVGAGQGDNSGVFAQRYNAAGNPQGGEFRVNTYTTGSQGAARVAMDTDGDFIIAWKSDGQDGSLTGVYAQRYNSSGVPQGGEFRVNTYTTWLQSDPSVAMDAVGDFVVTWTGYGPGDDQGIFAKRYDAAGVAQGGDFRVNTYTTGGQWAYARSAAMDSDGDFVIAWAGVGQSGEMDVHARRYNSAGVPQGAEFRVNTYTTFGQSVPAVAIDASGDFVVTWQSNYQDGSSSGIYAQRYNAAGVTQGTEFKVNTYSTNQQTWPAIAMDGEGDFVIAWTSTDQDGSGYGIYAQRFGVVPEVTASAFHFATAPHKLSFSFDRDVSASLGTDDLVVQNLTTMQTIPSSDFSISYDTLTNVATFTYTGKTAGIAGMLPDGNYTATLIASGITTIQGAPLASDYVQNFQFLQADADHDGRVNLQDFNILAANFGQSNRDFSQGDFNYDTTVNLNDFNILAARFGTVLAASAPSVGFGPNEIEDRMAQRDDPLTELLE